MPQALVLTAIVIGFAMTALFLVVLLASRGLAGTDHVDGEERAQRHGRGRGIERLARADRPPARMVDAAPGGGAGPVPLFTAALMLLLGEQKRLAKAALSVLSGLIGLVVALALLRWVNAADTGSGPGSIGVYLPGNWRAPFGIVLVADRLSTMMVALTGVVAFAASIYSTSRWDRAGVHFHPLLQLQLMGLNGAFLTGDLFNLFVFFEIMLAASYGLLLHGSGRLRVRAGMHYIAINLAASSLFLVGAALLYGVTGTLNMADLGQRIAQLGPQDRGLVHAAAAILATAFFAKAGAWPLNFWLVPAYSAAVSPVSAVFALLTKLGVYTVLRLWSLLFAPDAGASALYGQGVLIAIGLATLAIGALGILGTQRLSNLAAYCVLVSAGTLLAAVGIGQAGVWAGALYYLLSSTLAASAFFLLIDVVERWRNAGASIAAHELADNAPFLAEDLQSRPTSTSTTTSRHSTAAPSPRASPSWA